MPSSVRFGARPMAATIVSYSSGVRPCSATTSGVISCGRSFMARLSSRARAYSPAPAATVGRFYSSPARAGAAAAISLLFLRKYSFWHRHCIGGGDKILGQFGGPYVFDFQVASDAYRSEEHTSELQSLMRNSYAVFCLKKN